jgi:hypothetical protein
MILLQSLSKCSLMASNSELRYNNSMSKKNKVDVKVKLTEENFELLLSLLEEYANLMHALPADMKVEDKISNIEGMIFELEGAE